MCADNVAAFFERGTPQIAHIKVCLQVLGSTRCLCGGTCVKSCGSRGSRVKCDKVSGKIGEIWRRQSLKMLKYLGLWSYKEVRLTDVCNLLLIAACGQRIEATLAATIITPQSPIELSAVELHCGSCRHQDMTRKLQ